MSFEITGKLIARYPIIQRTESFRTREFVIEKTDDVNGRIINNYIKFQLVQDRCNFIDKYNDGDNIKVNFNIKGSKWEKEGKVNYITNLDAWRIEGSAVNPVTPPPIDKTPDYNTSQEKLNPSPEVVDDLPF